jgi:hypothetical protein
LSAAAYDDSYDHYVSAQNEISQNFSNADAGVHDGEFEKINVSKTPQISGDAAISHVKADAYYVAGGFSIRLDAHKTKPHRGTITFSVVISAISENENRPAVSERGNQTD